MQITIKMTKIHGNNDKKKKKKKKKLKIKIILF